MSRLRWSVGTVGTIVATYGALLALTRQDPLQLVEVALWLAGGVALHDGLIAGATLAAAVVARRVLPRPWLAPATLALVVWGGVTVMAVPVLGRFGARDDNATLLDRPYLTTWLAATTVVVLAVGVAGLVRARRTAER